MFNTSCVVYDLVFYDPTVLITSLSRLGDDHARRQIYIALDYICHYPYICTNNGLVIGFERRILIELDWPSMRAQRNWVLHLKVQQVYARTTIRSARHRKEEREVLTDLWSCSGCHLSALRRAIACCTTIGSWTRPCAPPACHQIKSSQTCERGRRLENT